MKWQPCHTMSSYRSSYEYYLGKQGRKRLGNKKWRGKVKNVVRGFRKAPLPDYVVLGGGNAAKLKRLPPQTRRGDNSDEFLGGFRLWEQNPSIGRPPVAYWIIRDEGRSHNPISKQTTASGSSPLMLSPQRRNRSRATPPS